MVKERETKYTMLLQSILQLRPILKTINSQSVTAVCRLEGTWQLPRGLVRTPTVLPHPPSFQFNGYEMKAGICVWNSSGWCWYPDQGTTLWEPLVHYTFDHWMTPLLKWNTSIKIKKKIKIICLVLRDTGQPVWIV